MRTECEDNRENRRATHDGGRHCARARRLGSPGPLVLVVEDEPEIAALMRDFLEADGFRVLLAADAEQAAGALRMARTACCST